MVIKLDEIFYRVGYPLLKKILSYPQTHHWRALCLR